jgi:hypothetical protein
VSLNTKIVAILVNSLMTGIFSSRVAKILESAYTTHQIHMTGSISRYLFKMRNLLDFELISSSLWQWMTGHGPSQMVH